MSRLFVLFAVASVAAASAMFELDESFRQADPDDVIGVFKQAFILNPLNCSERITHTMTASGNPPAVPHSAMRMNKKKCDDDGKMSVYFAASGAKAAVAESAAEGADIRATKDLINDVAASGADVIYGVEKKGRRCGGRNPVLNFAPGTAVMIFNPMTTVVVGSLPYPVGLRYMIVKDPEDRGLCIYSAKLRPMEVSPSPPVPGMSVTPTPVVGPGETPDGPTPTPTAGVTDPTDPSETPDETPDGTPDETGDPSPSPSPTEEDDDGSVCFPSESTVELEDGTVKAMAQIELGDRVKVADGMYSDVYMFTHKNSNTVHDFVRISTSAGATLTATKSHYIYINGGYAAAASAKVGDVMELGNGDRTTVNGVSVVRRSGLYNPQTLHGDIIVDSIRASTFTRTFEPSTAQGLLSPFRMIYGLFGMSMSFLDNGADKITAVLPRGQVAL